MRPSRAVFYVAFALAAISLASSWHAAHAQAWVGEKGALDLGLDYNLSVSNEVMVDDDGATLPDAGGMIHQFTLTGEYVPIKHLAVDLALPLQLIKYTGLDTGAYVHPGGGTYDDGNLHATLTDMRIGTHYQLLEDPIALSPIVAVSFPLEHYETVGNMVAGRHLTGLHLGLAAGRQLTDQLYVHLMYEFGLYSKYDRNADTAKYGQDTSDAVFLLGYKFLDNRLDINIGANLHITHDGIDFSKYSELSGRTCSCITTRRPPGGHASRRRGCWLSGHQRIRIVALAVRVFTWGANTQNATVYGLALTWNVL